MIGKLYIEWVREDLIEHEKFFLEELEYIKGYILQAVMWLTSRPPEWTHVVKIWLNLDEAPLEEDFYITVVIEPDKKISIALREISFNENIEVEEYTDGYVHIPPFDSEKLSEIEALREKVIEYIKDQRDLENKA